MGMFAEEMGQSMGQSRQHGFLLSRHPAELVGDHVVLRAPDAAQRRLDNL